MKPVRVLVVDASPEVRRLLVRALDGDADLEVIATAGDAYEARDAIVRRSPDVMALDLELPGMKGIAFLERLMPQRPMPVVAMGEAAAGAAAREAGALAYVEKSGQLDGGTFDQMVRHLRAHLKEAARVRFGRPDAARRSASPLRSTTQVRTVGTLIALGASTGGVEALISVLTRMPERVPCILVVQHMPTSFTAPFARRLDQLCGFSAREAEHGDLVRPGQCLVAPGDRQMRLLKSDGDVRVVLSNSRKVDGHRPSATVMMQSVARAMGPNASGAILTGMGRDGADGLLAMRRAGAHTVVQDEETSVVYGMPKAAWQIGAARYQLPLSHIAESLLKPFRL